MGESAFSRRMQRMTLLLTVTFVATVVPHPPPAAAACEAWVSPTGSDTAAGTASAPWRTLSHAADAVADAGCTVWFQPGVYAGSEQVSRRFASTTTFRSATPYRAILESAGTVLEIDGASNVVVDGFEIRHSGPGASGYVVIVDEGGGVWADHVTLRNNVIHDSFDNDLLKVHNGVRFATIAGNVFYNQGPSEQHIDVNSVTDVVVEANLFFNDFGASGRANPGNTKAFIVVKDSNEGADGLLGARRITIRRNVFAHWQGGPESIIQVGNDGKAYLEARSVDIVNNLFIGDGTDVAASVLGVAGAGDVLFANNTVTGDLPSKAVALRIVRKGSNPINEGVVLANTIWTDPTGTLGAEDASSTGHFTSGDPDSVTGLVLDSNLYWNGGRTLPGGSVVAPSDDPRAVVADPGLSSPSAIVTPVWRGTSFTSGTVTIAAEFARLVARWGVPGPNGGAPARADLAPLDDILGNPRGSAPSVGAVQVAATAFDSPTCPQDVIPSAGFTDVGSVTPEGRWAIDCLVFHGVAEGVASGRFAPFAAVPRWQMALFLVRSLDTAGVSLPSGADQGFADLAGLSAEAVTAVNRLAQLGVTTGVGDGRFDPGSLVPRWQMALFLVRSLDTAGVSLPSGADQGFVDLAGLAAEAVTAVNRLAQLEVTKGVGGSRFDPASPVPRWQMALFLVRTLDAAGVVP